MSLKYRTSAGTSASNFSDLVVKVGDTLPIGSEIDYDGQTVPAGWQEVDETNLGDVVVDSIRTKNLLNEKLIENVTISSTGISTSSNRLCTMQYIKVKPSTTYTVSFTTTNGINNININYYTTKSQPRDSATGWTSDLTFTTTSTAKYVMIVFRRSDDADITIADISNIQLEEGSSSTTYAPYQELDFDIKDAGNLVVDSIRSKNLINFIKLVNSPATDVQKLATGIRAIQLDSGQYRWTQSLLSNDLLGKTVTLTATITPSGANVGKIGVFFADNTTNPTSQIQELTQTGSVTFTIPPTFPSGSSKILILLYSNLNGTGQTNAYVDYTNLQLEEGTKATSYTPFQELDNQEVYSTGETKIGTWIDGKPIYRKVLKGTTGAVYTTKTIGTIANLGEIVRLDGFLRTSAQTIPGNFAYNNEQVSCYREDNNIIMRTTTSGYTNQNCYVIVEYTKTTD